MEKLQLLLEQDLGKIIVAIVILIIILVIVIIFANISSKRKKMMLENTRTLHKEEFEKAAKKRMELTQTVSRDEIKKELNAPKKTNIEHTLVTKKNEKSAIEKTQELNLESVRRKLMQDERNNNAPKPVNIADLEEQKPLKVEAVKKEEPVVSVTAVKEEEPVLNVTAVKEEVKPVIIAEKPEEVKEGVAFEDFSTATSTSDIVNEDLNAPEEDLFDSISLEFDEKLNDIASFYFSDTESKVDNILDGSALENIRLDEAEKDLDEEFSICDNKFDAKDIEEFDDTMTVDIDPEEEPEVKIDVWAEDFGFEKSEVVIDPEIVSFDDSEIENDSTSLFLAISSVSASERDLKRTIEFVDVEDQSVYINSFDFGNNYYADDVEYDNSGEVLFDFGLTINENVELAEVYDPIFDTYNDDDYTYIIPEVIVNPIFNNGVFEIGVEDRIDSTLTTAVAFTVNEQLIVENANAFNDLNIEIEKPDEVEVDVFENVTITNDEFVPSITVNSPSANEDYIVDVNSQLDQLDTYEMNLLDEFDFADENYNYNFNSINIMEEIVQDMFLDDFVEENDDEYFKYIYQFALLDDVIDSVNLEVNLDDIGLTAPIVESVDLELKEVVKTIEDEDLEEDEDLDIITNFTSKDFTLDSELLNLTSQVLDHQSDEDVLESRAYNPVITDKKPPVISPVFGNGDEKKEDLYEEDVSSSLFDIELDLGTDTEDKDVFELSDVEEEITDVDAFVNMIIEKIEETDETPNDEEEFLGVLKGLIKE